jgi:hypothetical protein
MLSAGERKEAIRKFKERKTPRGIFAVRCTATGRVWAGASPNLDAARNGTWFGLRLGGCRTPELQAEWNQHGEAAFAFEILEQLDDDAVPLLLRDLLEEKKAQWCARLGAQAL